MDLTNEEAQALIDLPKKIMVAEQPQDEYIMRFPGHIHSRFDLVSDDGNRIFLLEIRQEKPKRLKISLHFQENSQYEGLLRIDYNGKHKNPANPNQYVPEIAIPYVNSFIEENHIHFFVQGYKHLAWAVPLSVYNDFGTKDVSDFDSFMCAMHEFCQKINITTQCSIEGRLFL